MSDASNEDRQNTTVAPNEGHGYSCPTWCIDTGKCLGDHIGKAVGTTATGGLSPYVDDVEAPKYHTAVVRAQYPECDDRPPGVSLFGNYHDRDWQVDLTLKEAGILLAGLQAAIDTAGTV